MDMSFLNVFFGYASEFYIILSVFLYIIIYLAYKNLQLKQKSYFASRARECYNQMLYATKDGYFAFMYPDYNVKDPRDNIEEKCSRRLAVLLGLKNGDKSSFDEILKMFIQKDVKDLEKLVEKLREDGMSFEKECQLKNGKKIVLFANKISDIQGNVFCDIIWFRDISFANLKVGFLETSMSQINEKNITLENLFNATPFPLWARDKKLNIVFSNKAYKKICKNDEDILALASDLSTKNLPLKAISSKKRKKLTSNMIIEGRKAFFDFVETPVVDEIGADNLNTYGAAVETSELNEIKRKNKQAQSHQLEVFSALGTAFAIFNEAQELNFYNDSFLNFFKLERVWAEAKPTYSQFLDILREKRTIAEIASYKKYKEDELLAFENITSANEDLIFLTDEKTLKRVRSPYSQGGLIFAFADISNQISQQSQYTSLLNIQKDILNNMFDAVVVFAPDGRLSFYNQPFIEMWGQEEKSLKAEPSIMELIDAKKNKFSKVDDWGSFREELLQYIFNPSTKAFEINTDTDTIEVMSKSLFDGSIIITYRPKQL